MQTRRTAFFAATLTLAAAAGTARASDERLLVVVESGPGVAVDARDVRQTIGAELGVPVVAPSDAAAAGASNVLIVAVDKSDIRMSLRGSAAGLVARTIPSPLDRPTRLREIGWLAGNLARDQVSGIVAVPAERNAEHPTLLIAAADSPPAGAPLSAVSPPPPDPSPASAIAAATPAPTEIIAARPFETERTRGPLWAITAAGGPTAALALEQDRPSTVVRDTTFQLEIQRQSSPSSFIFGAALDIGTASRYYGSQLFGMAGFFGSGWHRRNWFLEATAGAGLEVARLPPTIDYTVFNAAGGATMSSETVSSDFQPLLYLRGTGTLGVPIAKSFDFVARVGVHLASSGGFTTDFLSATAGVRFEIP
jgi:hypothetical protein